MASVALRDPLSTNYSLMDQIRDATPAQRLAGGMLVVNALLSFVALGLIPDAPKSTALPGPGSVVSGIFDVVIGTMLIFNHGRMAAWALVRVVLGLVLFTLLYVVAGDLVTAAVQVGLSSALLLLLIGRAGILRLALGCVLFSLYLLVSVAGISALTTGHNPLGGLILGLKGELDGHVAGAVEGRASPFRLQVPDTGWSRRNAAIASRDNPLADLWLVQPNHDSHVVVIDEPSPGALAPIDVFTDAVIANNRNAASSFTLVSTEPLAAYPEDGRLLHTKYTIQDMNFEAWIGLVAVPGHSYQILGMTQQIGFAASSAELRAMVESFRPPEGPQQLPGVEPGPAGRVLGVAADYAITAPGERWQLRTAEAARADNPSADRWLIRPDRDAHVFVAFEDTAQPVPIDALATTLQDIMRSNNSAVEFGPIEPGPRGSLGFHVSLPTDKMTIEFEYRLHVVGTRSFQVVGFARKEFYPAVAAELRQALDSFEPPAS